MPQSEPNTSRSTVAPTPFRYSRPNAPTFSSPRREAESAAASPTAATVCSPSAGSPGTPGSPYAMRPAAAAMLEGGGSSGGSGPARTNSGITPYKSPWQRPGEQQAQPAALASLPPLPGGHLPRRKSHSAPISPVESHSDSVSLTGLRWLLGRGADMYIFEPVGVSMRCRLTGLQVPGHGAESCALVTAPPMLAGAGGGGGCACACAQLACSQVTAPARRPSPVL
jgi:hypothetical protein